MTYLEFDCSKWVEIRGIRTTVGHPFAKEAAQQRRGLYNKFC